jgi:predicted nucleic acid-binding protein
MRDQAFPQVLEWIDGHPSRDLYISAITRGEIERGLNLMPAGRRRVARAVVAAGIFESFEDRCLAFEAGAAVAIGLISARRIRSGRPIGTEDAQIAAIALVHRMKLATRNTRYFEGIDGLEVINPWAEKTAD